MLVGVLALTAASQGCNSYTAMGAGAAGVLVGGVMLANAGTDEECEPYDVFCGEATLLTTTLNVGIALAVMGMSGALLIGGAAGATYDAVKHGDQPRATAAAPTVATASLEGKTRATTELALHIRVAARANRCPAAFSMANTLARIDPALVTALIKRDEFVAHCIAEPGAAPTAAPTTTATAPTPPTTTATPPAAPPPAAPADPR